MLIDDAAALLIRDVDAILFDAIVHAMDMF